jgi:hypothetical protein
MWYGGKMIPDRPDYTANDNQAAGGYPPSLYRPWENTMKRVNTYNFYQLGTILHPLVQLKSGAKLKDIVFDLLTARNWLSYFLNEKLVQISVCKPTGWKVLNALSELVPEKFPDNPEELDKEIDWSHMYDITQGIKEFEIVLSAELQAISTYHVSQKAAYSTSDLIERAEIILTEGIRKQIPTLTITDIQQAGRCLAFECPTAAGFHILRATEAVIREYYRIVVGKAPKNKMRNWGSYIKILKDNGADTKVLGVLDQIREIHRNPIMHPETILTTDEAIVLLGVAQSAIVVMALDIQKRKGASATTLLTSSI